MTYDITIDNDTSLYLLGVEGLVTHNSFSCLLDAHHVWKTTEEDVLFVSLEMPHHQVGYRWDSLEAGYSSKNLNRGRIEQYNQEGELIVGDIEGQDEHYREYIQSLESSTNRFYVVTRQNVSGRLTPEYIYAMAKDKGVGLIVVDYIGICDSPYDHDSTAQAAYVAKALKNIALDLNVPILAPHQLNRAGAKGEVGLEHFADSDAVGRYIDLGMDLKKERMDGGEAEDELQETGQYNVSYKVIGNRHGPEGARFGWRWNYDNGHRSELGDYEMLRDPSLGIASDEEWEE